MRNMFSNCSSLTSLNLSKFDINNVINMNNMFSECTSLTSLNLTNFRMNNKINMRNMFYNLNQNCKIICNDPKIYSENGSEKREI